MMTVLWAVLIASQVPPKPEPPVAQPTQAKPDAAALKLRREEELKATIARRNQARALGIEELKRQEWRASVARITRTVIWGETAYHIVYKDGTSEQYEGGMLVYSNRSSQ